MRFTAAVRSSSTRTARWRMRPAARPPRAVTVPYGTEATCYQRYMDALVLGPGDIDQADTVGEWNAVEQLQGAVEV